MRIALSLVSHTNVGKTTLARTLLGRDVGVVRDEPHVTEAAERWPMIEVDGHSLELWDTPGFGDSARLAKRLEQQATPIGWFLAELWDRFRDRPFWSSQQAVRNVLEQADVVLYLVNAAEDPRDAGYVAPEMRVLELLAKPVVVLLNQLGEPKPPARERAEIGRWRESLAAHPCVREVLALDAFARCWVQEIALLRTIGRLLDDDSAAAFEVLARAWQSRREETFARSMRVLARRIAHAATVREVVTDTSLGARLSELARTLNLIGDGSPMPRQIAIARLAAQLDENVRASTDELIALHGLSGRAREQVIARLVEHYSVQAGVSEGKAALLGGAVTGALAGLKADLATAGMTLGGGLLTGGVLGALAAAGLARGVNLIRGTDRTHIQFSEELLFELVAAALLAYLAVAHFGRGRGQWMEGERPTHWSGIVAEVVQAHRAAIDATLALRSETDEDALARGLHEQFLLMGRGALAALYPDASKQTA